MKILITFFVSLFLSSVSAKDIKDYEIEGMKIGDTLLQFYDKKVILENIEDYQYVNNDFYQVGFYGNLSSEFKTFDAIQVSLKTNDPNFIIYSIGGGIFYNNNINHCYSKQNELIREIQNLFPSIEISNFFGDHPEDASGESKITQTNFDFENLDSIRISCFDWSEKLFKKYNWTDHLKLNLDTKEYSDWLMYKAY